MRGASQAVREHAGLRQEVFQEDTVPQKTEQIALLKILIDLPLSPALLLHHARYCLPLSPILPSLCPLGVRNKCKGAHRVTLTAVFQVHPTSSPGHKMWERYATCPQCHGGLENVIAILTINDMRKWKHAFISGIVLYYPLHSRHDPMSMPGHTCKQHCHVVMY